MSDAQVILFPMVPAAARTRAENDRKAFLDIRAFEAAERLAEGVRQASFEKAARELERTPVGYDHHNAAVRDAEVRYLTTVIAAAEKHGVLAHGWRATLATLPPVISSAVRAEGKAYW